MAAAGYARTYQAQAILTASPGQLILMLYDGALRFMDRAEESLTQPTLDDPRTIEQINNSLQKAQAIIAELQSSLNHEAGGDYSANLDRLYDYYQRRLFEANVRKDPAPVREVSRLLRNLRDGWAEMLRTQETPSSIRGVA